MKDERKSAVLIQRVKEETLQRIRDDQEGAPADVAEILAVIEKGIFGGAFDVNDLRRSCVPTEETLRAFRARFGGAFKSYLTDRRLAVAERLVDEPEVDLAEIAEALGFASLLAFARWFRRWTGKTPEGRRSALQPRSAPVSKKTQAVVCEDAPISLWFQARVTALRHDEIDRLIAFIRARAEAPRGAPV